jgi:hypothetical protein
MDAQHGKLPYIHGNKRDIKVIKWLLANTFLDSNDVGNVCGIETYY